VGDNIHKKDVGHARFESLHSIKKNAKYGKRKQKTKNQKSN